MTMRPILLAVALTGCGGGARKGALPAPPAPDKAPEIDLDSEWVDPEAMAQHPRATRQGQKLPTRAVVIRHGTVLTAAGKRIDDGALLLEDGRISAVGAADLAAPEGALEIDARGRFVTPGIIDAHSHIGVYPAPATPATSDGNEATDPNTAGVAAEYAYTAQDPAIARALAGGVTAALILPGSANLIGGRGVTVEMRPGRRIDDVRFPGAPSVLKMACGENPKRVYGKKSGPQTRMGEYAAFRAAFQAAADYALKWKQYRVRRGEWERRRARAVALDAESDARARRTPGKRPLHVKPEAAPDPPARDARLESLAGVMAGTVLAQVHCYTVRDMAQMLAISDQFGFDVRAFHHAIEAYKIRDLLSARGVAIATWADWWGFKLEAFDGIMENAALMAEAGGRAAIHSDSSIGIQRLNQEAAKAMYAGRAAGIDVSEDAALRMITANPAWILGIDRDTGTLEAGKRADVVVWSAHPFSVYAHADLVLIAGRVEYQRERGIELSDFEVGNSAPRAVEVAK